MRIYVVNHSKTHRDKYVANGDGVYLKFSCDLPDHMSCEAPLYVKWAFLAAHAAYNMAASERDALRAEEALEASGK